MNQIILNGQVVATCLPELVKPFVNTLVSLVGNQFSIAVIEEPTNDREPEEDKK